jgi:peptidoglycan/xylan/chitin deacetylase (PgdA/CDA1 family)
MTERDSMPAVDIGLALQELESSADSARVENGGLTLAPRPVSLLKAGLTHGRSALWLAGGARDLSGPGLRVLCYHRVSDDRDVLAVTPKRFAEQMRFLADEGYRAVEVARIDELLSSQSPPRWTIGLSFDDGYRDVAEHALPLLAELGFTATLFVVSGAADGRASFGWYETSPPVLDWEELAELDREGVLRIGAHTVTHPNLTLLDEERAQGEIEGSKRQLEERLGHAVETFCYPAGLFGERERRLVAEAGFRAAVSCEPGLNTPATDRFALQRVQIDASDTLLDFRAKVAGAHDAPLPGRALYRRLRYPASSRA